jgi:hypothetical protein
MSIAADREFPDDIWQRVQEDNRPQGSNLPGWLLEKRLEITQYAPCQPQQYEKFVEHLRTVGNQGVQREVGLIPVDLTQEGSR